MSSTFQAELQPAFQRTGLQCSSEVISTSTPLCKHHYHLVYSALQQRECATCPKLDVIQKHLKESTGFEGEIFTMCYKSHLLVLKENKPISRDIDLEELIITISTYTEQIPPTDEVITAHDVIKTVVRVGHILRKSKQYCCLVFATFL